MITKKVNKRAKPKKLRSGLERRIAATLKKAKVKYKYETTSYHYSIKIRAECRECGSKECYTNQWYTPDFFLPNAMIIEAKGNFTGKDRKKMVAMKEQHPHLDLRIVFMRDNKLSKLSTTRYSEWAENLGYKFAIGNIPDTWIKETK
jgi:hypothetical protein